MKAQNNQNGKSDIRADSGILKYIPDTYRPYALLARLDRPIGFWLLGLPGLWAIWLSSNGFSVKAVWLSALFMIGAVAMRAAGCVINDIWDRDLDKKVERTAVRPLAAEDLSLKQAAVFLLVLLFIGLMILMQMNVVTVVLGILSVPLIIAYPLMKRITFWPQAFLGLTFNFGVLMGWAAMTETLEAPTFLLYIGAIFWTIGYDTIYAHQDIEDDMLAGIKSTALKFGDSSKQWVIGFYALAFLFMLIAFAMQSVWGAIALVPVAWHMSYQILKWDVDNTYTALQAFKSNRNCGLLILAAALVVALV